MIEVKCHIGGTKLTPHIWNMLCIFALKYFLSILHVSNILILQNFMVDKLMIEDTDSVCEIQPL